MHPLPALCTCSRVLLPTGGPAPLPVATPMSARSSQGTATMPVTQLLARMCRSQKRLHRCCKVVCVQLWAGPAGNSQPLVPRCAVLFSRIPLASLDRFPRSLEDDATGKLAGPGL